MPMIHRSVTFRKPDNSELAALDRIAKGNGEVPAADIRELARITRLVASHVDGLNRSLEQLAQLLKGK